MRASRLLSILTTLQARGQVTAPELADTCEVSVRTIYRDIDALAAAGIPVYADRGAEGGYRLLDGYRVRLNGLSQPEAEALFMTGLPGPAAALGLDAAMLAAQTKLMAALPANLRPNASRMQERFHLDAPSWFGEAEQPKHLRAIAGALLRESPIEIRYQSWRAEKRRRLAPLGLVLKGGSWYLAGHVDDSVRTYRVARVLDCNVLDEHFVRPADFDLAAYWQASTIRLEAEMHPNIATVRLSPFGIKLLNALSQPYVRTRTRIEEAADSGSRKCRSEKPCGTRQPSCCVLARRRRCWRRPSCATRWPNSPRPWPHAIRRRNMVTGIERISADLALRNIPETRFPPTRVNARRLRSD
jgi:predicted DNA-binding transcriptional regulator YafY